MTCLLQVTVSPRGPGSFSRRVGGALVASLREAIPGLRVIQRDLAAAPLPHPDEAFVRAMLMPAAERDAAENDALALSETLIAEVEAADLVLISTPMNNFTVPSALKAWIDHTVRIARTFRSTPAGKIGLLRDRPVLVVIACGGRFGEDPGAQADFLTPYLRYVLATIGLTNLAVLRLEELNRGTEKVAQALDGARRWIEAQSTRLGAVLPDATPRSGPRC